MLREERISLVLSLDFMLRSSILHWALLEVNLGHFWNNVQLLSIFSKAQIYLVLKNIIVVLLKIVTCSMFVMFVEWKRQNCATFVLYMLMLSIIIVLYFLLCTVVCSFCWQWTLRMIVNMFNLCILFIFLRKVILI